MLTEVLELHEPDAEHSADTARILPFRIRTSRIGSSAADSITK